MLLLAVALAANPTSFPSTLTRPLLAKAERWQWPAPNVFQRAWEVERKANSGELVVQGIVTETAAAKPSAPPASEPHSSPGNAPHQASGYFLVVKAKDRHRLLPLALVSGFGWAKYREWRVTEPAGQEWKLEDGARFHLAARLDATMSQADLVPWTYARTLFASSGDLYADDAGDDDELSKTVQGHKDVEAVKVWVAKNKLDERLYQRFRSFRPMGRCSMDTLPQAAARAYAELAYARGDLGRFLQLQVLIMGDQFDRRAWSSYGEAVHGTEAERLTDTGIDVDQFLMGLLIAKSGQDQGLGVWRLARSIREAGRTAALRPRVQAVAEAALTDPYNRLRATQVWVYLAQDETGALDAASALSLHPVAKAWVAQMQNDTVR